MPAAASTEPTDRSMPPVAITNVIPIAITPTTLAWVSMFRMLSEVGKLSGSRIEPTTKMRTTTIPSAYSWYLSRASGPRPDQRPGRAAIPPSAPPSFLLGSVM